MSDDDFEHLKDIDVDLIPDSLRPFAVVGRPPSLDEQTWGYFAHGYSIAFEELARETLRLWPRREYLRLPVFLLCRHSLELALKGAIREYAEHVAKEARTNGHNLYTLWRKMLELIANAGYSVDDEWTAYCEKIISHIHEVDPDGERFRYPSNTAGIAFAYTRVDLEGLVNAQSNVATYCDAVVTMLREDSRNSY